MTAAFGLAVAAQRLSLYRYALNLTRNRDDAEDLVQETMCRALRYEHLFEPGTNLIAWLNTIMRNERFDVARRPKLFVPDDDGARTDAMPSNDDTSAAFEARDALSHLGDLSEKYSRALTMCADGLSTADIADREGVPEGTVKSRLHRARLAFADLIGGTP
jgi:RNA polymerase sigma-70 factor (ECF subfamily)